MTTLPSFVGNMEGGRCRGHDRDQLPTRRLVDLKARPVGERRLLIELLRLCCHQSPISMIITRIWWCQPVIRKECRGLKPSVTWLFTEPIDGSACCGSSYFSTGGNKARPLFSLVQPIIGMRLSEQVLAPGWAASYTACPSYLPPLGGEKFGT